MIYWFFPSIFSVSQENNVAMQTYLTFNIALYILTVNVKKVRLGQSVSRIRIVSEQFSQLGPYMSQ